MEKFNITLTNISLLEAVKDILVELKSGYAKLFTENTGR